MYHIPLLASILLRQKRDVILYQFLHIYDSKYFTYNTLYLILTAFSCKLPSLYPNPPPNSLNTPSSPYDPAIHSPQSPKTTPNDCIPLYALARVTPHNQSPGKFIFLSWEPCLLLFSLSTKDNAATLLLLMDVANGIQMPQML